NSAPTAEDLALKLKHLGIRELNPRHFYTSALNTADFLSETHPNCTAFVIGESGLAAALHEKKIANDAISPNYVVVGEGAATTDKLARPTKTSNTAHGWSRPIRTTGVRFRR